MTTGTSMPYSDVEATRNRPTGNTVLELLWVRMRGIRILFQAPRPAKMLTTPSTGRAKGQTKRAKVVHSPAPSTDMASNSWRGMARR